MIYDSTLNTTYQKVSSIIIILYTIEIRCNELKYNGQVEIIKTRRKQSNIHNFKIDKVIYSIKAAIILTQSYN